MGSFHPGGARALPVPLQRFLLKVCPHPTSCFHCCEIPAAAKISSPVSGWFCPTSLLLSASHEHFHRALSAPDIPMGVPCVWVPPFCSLQMPLVINGKDFSTEAAPSWWNGPAQLSKQNVLLVLALQAFCFLFIYLYIFLNSFFLPTLEIWPQRLNPHFPCTRMLSTNEIPPAQAPAMETPVSALAENHLHGDTLGSPKPRGAMIWEAWKELDPFPYIPCGHILFPVSSGLIIPAISDKFYSLPIFSGIASRFLYKTLRFRPFPSSCTNI